jgi:hypothetical protein
MASPTTAIAQAIAATPAPRFDFEAGYQRDLWARHSWRFICTLGMLTIPSSGILVQWLVRPNTVRPHLVVLNGMMMCPSILCISLFFLSRRKKYQWAVKMFNEVREAVQHLWIVIGMCLPSIGLYNAFIGCADEDSTLEICYFLRQRIPPIDLTINIILSPVILMFLNVPFSTSMPALTVAFSGLITIYVKVLFMNDLECLTEECVTPVSPLLSICFCPFVFMSVAMWQLEENDRQAYRMRHLLEQRHNKLEIKLAQVPGQTSVFCCSCFAATEIDSRRSTNATTRTCIGCLVTRPGFSIDAGEAVEHTCGDAACRKSMAPNDRSSPVDSSGCDLRQALLEPSPDENDAN